MDLLGGYLPIRTSRRWREGATASLGLPGSLVLNCVLDGEAYGLTGQIDRPIPGYPVSPDASASQKSMRAALSRDQLVRLASWPLSHARLATLAGNRARVFLSALVRTSLMSQTLQRVTGALPWR
jgi:hypothetical protein